MTITDERLAEALKIAKAAASAMPIGSTSDQVNAAAIRAVLEIPPALEPQQEEPVAFQDRVAEAHVALFHDDPTDIAERRDRFGEEANELQQALGQTREAAHQLVDYTYDRPIGQPEKEIGAAALTLASLCVVGGWDMQSCAEADLAALQTPEKIAKVRAKRATRHGRGPLPGFDAALVKP